MKVVLKIDPGHSDILVDILHASRSLDCYQVGPKQLTFIGDRKVFLQDLATIKPYLKKEKDGKIVPVLYECVNSMLRFDEDIIPYLWNRASWEIFSSNWRGKHIPERFHNESAISEYLTSGGDPVLLVDRYSYAQIYSVVNFLLRRGVDIAPAGLQSSVAA